MRMLLLSCIAAVLPAAAARADNAVAPGEVIVEPPTLICLGFEWRVEGDENHNATVAVAYRKKGSTTWRRYMPLFRTGRERTVDYGYGNFGDPHHDKRYVIPEALMGSLMDLEPNTAYEVRLTMADPDGVRGEAVRVLTLRTCAEPVPAAGGEVRHVYPPGYKGKKLEPAYRSIMHAVNGFHPWCDCYQTVHPNRAPPGTVVKLHAGTYKIDRFNYREPTQRWLHGAITLVADGTAERPIAIVSAGDGEVVIDGSGCHNLFNVMAADYLHFEGLTIRNTDIAFHGGLQGVIGCKGLTVKGCWIEDVTYGVLAQDGRSEGFYIADNVILGRNPHDRFNPKSGGAWGKTKGGYAVNVAGKGHVICHNYAADMWDVINVFTSSLADPALSQQSRAIDIYNNDVFNATDNFIEADGGYANIRILRNRCFNCMASPVSVQPVYVGPSYWIQNVFWNTFRGRSGIKPDGNTQVLVYLHNTTSCHMRTPRVEFWDIRNNLFMGPAEIRSERERQRGPRIAWYAAPTGAGRAIDHNAYRTGLPAAKPWRVGSQEFATMAEMARATGCEAHGLTVKGYGDVFEDADEPTHAFSNKDPLVGPKDVDLRLKADSAMVDAAAAIPGVNDDFTGKAPDVGAYERGKPIPIYGPRSGGFLERLRALREDKKPRKP